LRGFEVAQSLFVCGLKFRDRLAAAQILFFYLATIDGFAVIISQPFDQRSAASLAAVITLARHRLARGHRIDQRLVIRQASFDQKEALAGELLRSLAEFVLNFQTDDAARGLRSLGDECSSGD